MNTLGNIITIFLFVTSGFALSQSANFKVKTTGVQTFNFTDKAGRNQIIFYSKMPLEDITGTVSGITGTVQIDPSSVTKTMSGGITADVKSMQTGIAKRDEHMQGEAWMNAAKFPVITFILKAVMNLKSVGANQIEGSVSGDFTLHGITKNIVAPVTLVYMEASEKTKMRAPGDLLQLRTKFSVKLSDYDIKGAMNLIGQKINDQIDIEMNIVGSNAIK